MKTATITYHNVYNYGALLQAYALQQMLLKLSIDNVIINYNFEKNRIYHKMKGNSLKIFIINIIRLLKTIIDILPIMRRCRNFEEFSNRKLQLTPKYRDLEELRKNPPEADCYIAGSDQLWNVSTVMRNAFFLDFGSQDTKRVSYAVSMGSYEIPNEYIPKMCELLNKFDTISVRETEAKIYIENIIDKKDFVHLNFDPVFLLSKKDWSEFACTRRIGIKYILCYPMSGHPLLYDALKKLKQLTGYKIIILTSEVFDSVKGDVYIKDATPEEFVFLIQNAEYTLTSSFHGTAFCTIFNKNFFSFVGGTAPTRITGLLGRLGLEHRIVRRIEDINTEEVDYFEANNVIAKEKKLAKEYLLSLFPSDHREKISF